MQYGIGPLVIDATALAIRAGDATLPLGPKVVATLAVLCERPGEVVGKTELIERVWPDGAIDETSLWQNVHLLRRTLSEHTGERGIENVRGRGYRLVLPVRVLPAPPAAATSRRPRLERVAVTAALAIVLLTGTGLSALFARHGGGAAGTEAGRRAIPDTPAALRLARYYLGRRTLAGARRAARIFAREGAAHPRDARGPAGLAEAEMMLSLMYGGASSSSGRRCAREAERAAARALALDPSSAAAQTAEAMVAENLDGRFGLVDSRYRAALARDPDYAPAYLRYGISLLMRGSVRPALGQLRRAAELDPSSAVTALWLANALYVAHRPNEAAVAARHAVTLDTQPDDARTLLGFALLGAGHASAARAVFASFLREAPAETRAHLAEVAAVEGDVQRARREITAASRSTADVPWGDIAFAELALGDRDGAYAALRRLPPLPRIDRSLLALDPRLDGVRSDRRFDRWTRIRAVSAARARTP